MPSTYSIIQYVPNPLADERINIGVLAFDNREVRVYFVRNWERVRYFSGQNTSSIKDFAARMRKSAKSGLLFPGDENNELSKSERLERVAKSWMNSIQFTEPRGSLKDLERVFEDAIKKFLVEPAPLKNRLRDRQAAARLTISTIKLITKEYLGEKADYLLKEKYALAGTHKQHEIDIAVANSHNYLAAQGISFEVKTPENLLDALAWTITDVKDNNPNFPLAVVILPPKKEESIQYKQLESIYLKTRETYKQLGADVLSEQEIQPWVTTQLAKQTFKF